MSIRIECLSCGYVFRRPDPLMGKPVKCPECRVVMVAPDTAPATVVSSDRGCGDRHRCVGGEVTELANRAKVVEMPNTHVREQCAVGGLTRKRKQRKMAGNGPGLRYLIGGGAGATVLIAAIVIGIVLNRQHESNPSSNDGETWKQPDLKSVAPAGTVNTYVERALALHNKGADKELAFNALANAHVFGVRTDELDKALLDQRYSDLPHVSWTPS